MTGTERLVRVRVAEMAVLRREGTLSTIGLGSCVAIVLYDAEARVGGLAHVLLPGLELARDRSNAAKFPETAVPSLLNAMEREGARRERVRARLVGGASMFTALLPLGGMNIGERNVIASRAALETAGVPIDGEDVGRDHGRSVFLDIATGAVEVRSLRAGSRAL